jgi:LacI family transcriptional regulator
MKPLRKVILLIPPGREFERGVLRGISEYAQIHGPWLFYEEPPPYLDDEAPENRLAHMREWHADGIIAHQSRAEEIRDLNLPTVFICSTHNLPPTTYQLRNDNDAIGHLAANYLLSLGFKNLAYCGLHGMEWSAQRGESFSKTAAKAEVESHMYQPFTPRPGEAWYREQNHLGNWLASLPKPIGLFACNDDRARMITEICMLREIRVPDEISILGVDNDEHVCNRSHPPTSSIALATERGGYEAAALLARVMADKPVKSNFILTRPVRVVSRPSTDLIAIHDPHIVKAIRFIREKNNRIIQVHDVVTAAGVSRRILQDRFKQLLGRSVLAEIHQTRTQYICRMLADTDLSMAAIATAIGYDTDSHLSRFFVRNTGMTPTEYRRLHRRS